LAAVVPESSPDLPITATKGIKPHSVVLLNSDKGERQQAEVTRLADESVIVHGADQKCAHYSLSGDVQVHLWYDDQRRLVRQQSIEQGHRTELFLLTISANGSSSE